MKETTPDSPSFDWNRDAGTRRKHYSEKACRQLPVRGQNLAVSLYGKRRKPARGQRKPRPHDQERT